LLVKYLETYLSDLEWWLSEWRIAINVSKSSAMLFVKTEGASPNTDRSNSSGSQSNGSIPPVILGWPSINSSPGRHISIRRERNRLTGWEHWVLSEREVTSPSGKACCLYKQLIRPMMDYACPVWRSAARSHIKKLQVMQSKCLRIAANAPRCIGN
jgi:hypothetical protein